MTIIKLQKGLEIRDNELWLNFNDTIMYKLFTISDETIKALVNDIKTYQTNLINDTRKGMI